MMIIDLDNFKMVNDTFGHLFGNVVLAESCCADAVDIPSRRYPFRIGGDEFLVYMNDISSKMGPVIRAEQLIGGIRGVLREKLGSFVLSCSIGLSFTSRRMPVNFRICSTAATRRCIRQRHREKIGMRSMIKLSWSSGETPLGIH